MNNIIRKKFSEIDLQDAFFLSLRNDYPGFDNGALKKRIVRHDLIGQIGLERNQYWGFFELTDEEFNLIAKKGEVDKILVQTN